MHDFRLLLKLKNHILLVRGHLTLCNSDTQSDVLCYSFTVRTTIIGGKNTRLTREKEKVLLEITQAYVLHT